MLVCDAGSSKIRTVLYVQHSQTVNFILCQPLFSIQLPQIPVCFFKRFGAIIFIILSNNEINRRPGLYYGFISAVPLGTAHQRSRKQLRLFIQNQGKRFPAARITVNIDFCRIDFIMAEKIFRQRNRLVCRCLPPSLKAAAPE